METTHFIGIDNAGMRYYVGIRLVEKNEPSEMTDHTTRVLTYRFSADGFSIKKRKREADSAGQMLDKFKNITEPAEGWKLEDIQSIVAIWSRWHLNDMRAWSDEQRDEAVAANFDYDKLKALTDSTGYQYGHKWLAEQIPADVIAEIKRIMSLPCGDVPDSY